MLRTRGLRLSLGLFWALVLCPFLSPSILPPLPGLTSLSLFSFLFLLLFVRLFSVSLDRSLPHLFLSICHFECLPVPASFWHLWSSIPVSTGTFVSACRVFLLASVSTSLSTCLSVSVSSLDVCVSISLRQPDTPPVSYLMCSFEIPFEYCRSRLTVTKETGQKKWRDQGGGDHGVWAPLSVFLFFGTFLFQSRKKGQQFKMIFQESI